MSTAQPAATIGSIIDVAINSAFDETRLAAYLTGRIVDFSGPMRVQQFEGGQSNPTFLLSTPDHRYVLRRKPAGVLLKSAHAVDREYRITMALHEAGLPVAEPLLLCEDEDKKDRMLLSEIHCKQQGRGWGASPRVPGPLRRTFGSTEAALLWG